MFHRGTINKRDLVTHGNIDHYKTTEK